MIDILLEYISPLQRKRKNIYFVCNESVM